MVAECRLYLYSINGIKFLGKRFRAPVWALCQYLFRMKVTKGRLSLPETQSAKNRFDAGVVLHYYLKNLSWCKPCPQCNMSYILAFFSLQSFQQVLALAIAESMVAAVRAKKYSL